MNRIVLESVIGLSRTTLRSAFVLTAILGWVSAATAQTGPPPPTVQFFATTYTVNEAAGSVTLSVVLSSASTQVVTVDYATSDGTAISEDWNGDYVAANGTVTFQPGEVSKDLPAIAISDDDVYESTEYFVVTLSNPTNSSLGPIWQATVNILDDDPMPTVQFDSSDYVVNESGDSVGVIVTITGNTGQPLSVDYATSDGTAVAGTDYQATSGTLTFDPDQPGQILWFDVMVMSDGVVSPNKTVNLTLSNPQGASLGTPSSAILTILDDTQPPLPSLSFSASQYSVNVSAGASTITVNLSASSSQPVSVYYATSDGTALTPDDYTAASDCLNFAPGETSKTFQVSVTDNFIAGVNKTIELTLSGPQNAVLGSPITAELTMVNDNTSPPSGNVQFASGDGGSIPPVYLVNKAQGVAEITVVNAPSSFSVSVDYATSDDTAVAPDDYEPAAGTLTFAPGDAVGTFEVNLNQGSAAPDNVKVGLALTNPVNAVLGALTMAFLEVEEAKPAASIQPGASQAGTTGDVVPTVKTSGGVKHYVSPKKASDFVVVKASVTGAKVTFDKAFQWGAGGVAGTNADERKVARDATGTGPTTLTIIRKSDMAVVDTMKVWIVWATWTAETKRRLPLKATDSVVSFTAPSGRPLMVKPQVGARGPGLMVYSYWTFQATIAPVSILDVTQDVPKLNLARTQPVPGATKIHVLSDRPLSGGADLRWDMSRQLRINNLFPTLRTGDFPAVPGTLWGGKPFVNRIAQEYPDDEAEGNDDPTTGSQDNNPYSADQTFWRPSTGIVRNPVGAMSNVDGPPTPQFLLSAGANGDTAEQRNQFREFARLQIGDSGAPGYRNWYRISDYFLWRQHAKLKKVAGTWVDDGSVADATNAGW